MRAHTVFKGIVRGKLTSRGSRKGFAVYSKIAIVRVQPAVSFQPNLNVCGAAAWNAALRACHLLHLSHKGHINAVMCFVSQCAQRTCGAPWVRNGDLLMVSEIRSRVFGFNLMVCGACLIGFTKIVLFAASFWGQTQTITLITVYTYIYIYI